MATASHPHHVQKRCGWRIGHAWGGGDYFWNDWVGYGIGYGAQYDFSWDTLYQQYGDSYYDTGYGYWWNGHGYSAGWSYEG